jgi:hypothetical protein
LDIRDAIARLGNAVCKFYDAAAGVVCVVAFETGNAVVDGDRGWIPVYVQYWRPGGEPVRGELTTERGTVPVTVGVSGPGAGADFQVDAIPFASSPEPIERDPLLGLDVDPEPEPAGPVFEDYVMTPTSLDVEESAPAAGPEVAGQDSGVCVCGAAVPGTRPGSRVYPCTHGRGDTANILSSGV